MADVYGDQWAVNLARGEDEETELVAEAPVPGGLSLQRREPAREARARTPPGHQSAQLQQTEDPGSGHHLRQQVFAEPGNAYVSLGEV